MSSRLLFVFLVLFLGCANGQQDEVASPSCYGAGSIVTTVILTLLIAGCLLAGGYYAWLKYWKPRKERHLILETDPERGVKDEYAFDNPGFKDAALTPSAAATIEKSEKSKVDGTNKSRWSQWSPLGVLTLKNEKRRTVDDNEIKINDVKIIALRSHDFTGLGFNICGNMKEGIFIKDLLHRGPASECGKLHTGDRIRSLTINFEHMVFEDALTILSYASPYDVVIEVQGHKNHASSGPFAQPRHPLYKSASSTDLLQIKSARKSLFCDESSDRGSLTNLQKSLTKNIVPSLERNKSKSPKPAQIFHRNSKNVEADNSEKVQEDSKQQNISTYQSKFGVKVLPMEQSPTKTFELSQNDNNLNLERTNLDELPIHHTVTILSIDEVDQKRTSAPPPVKKREKLNIAKPSEDIKTPILTEDDQNKFQRNNSGIMRDQNGIPQEMPSHMFNAALAARKNRKSQPEEVVAAEEVKPLKKSKGKAPSPPEDSKQLSEDRYNSDSDLDEMDESKSSVNTIELNSSDITVHQASEEHGNNEEKQNRKTASTGDLTKIVKTTKTSSGTLERAQSLDITDNQPINTLAIKKHKSVDEPSDNLNDETLDDDSDEVKLSTMLNGLNTFQRNRLKKSTEWGNLEDAISSFSNDDCKLDSDESFKISCENIETKGEEITALVNKINEIKLEGQENVNEEIEKVEKEATELKNDIIKIEQAIKETNLNQIWPNEIDDDNNSNPNSMTEVIEAQNKILLRSKLEEIIQEASDIVHQNQPPIEENQQELDLVGQISSLDFLTMEREACSKDYHLPILATTNVSDDMKASMGSLERTPNIEDEEVIVPKVKEVVHDEFKITFPQETLSQSDNKTSIESTVEDVDLTNLDNEIVDLSRINISNITIFDDQDDKMNVPLYPAKKLDSFSVTHLNHDEKLPVRLENSAARILSTPDLIQNITIREAMNDVNNQANLDKPRTIDNHLTFEGPVKSIFDIDGSLNHVTIEGPSSLSLEITGQPKRDLNGDFNNHEHSSDQDANSSKHSSLTYITEIQVTPMLKRNVSEIEIIRDKNLDSEFENYVKNFDIKSSSLDNLDLQPDSLSLVNNEVTVSLDSNLDIQKEINKIQEIADQQLKKLPEMRFSSSSYESQYNREVPNAKRHSQIEILRSNFEKVSLPRHTKDPSPPKSRIPVALTTTKTPPTSPERRDSRTDLEQPDKEIIEIMNNSNIPNFKYNPNKVAGSPGNNRNITVTSIRSNSKIPSGLPTYNNNSGGTSNVRPPVAPRKSLDNGQITDGHSHIDNNHGNVTIVTNGADNSSSFKQWVFNPNDSNGNNNTSVTNITVMQTKYEK